MFNKCDTIILYSIYFLIIIGILTLISIPRVSNYMLIKHIVSIILGLNIIYFTSRIKIFNYSKLIFITSILISIYALLFGRKINGSKRWISCFGIFSLQPTELLKPSLAVLNGFFICSNHYIKSMMYIFSSILICLLQPDFGSTFIIIVSSFAQMLIYSFSIGLILFVTFMILILAIIGYFFTPYIYNRVTEFIFSNGDIFGIKYQVIKSLEAISHGGFSGIGYYNGSVKAVLPDAYTDFIISVIAEEFGIVMIVFIYILYIIVIVRFAIIAIELKNIKTLVASAGLIMQIVLHIIMHTYSAVGLMPPKGTILPFISYGGSAMIGFCTNIGMLFAMNKRKNTFFRFLNTSYNK